MKSMNCDLCDASYEAENFEGWTEQMKTHYAEAHQEVMQGKADLSPAEKQQEMMQWMNKARDRFMSLPDMA